MPQDLLDILCHVVKSDRSKSLRFYIVEIFIALTELGFAHQSIDFNKKNLNSREGCFFSKGVSTVKEGGKQRILSASEQKDSVWNHSIRKQCSCAFAPINVYIKSVRTLENKIALLINEKENLGFGEHEVLPSTVRVNKRISVYGKDLLAFFKNQKNTKEVLKERHSMEHRKSKINHIILFFLSQNAPAEKDFVLRMKELKDILQKVYDSHLEIHNILLPQLFNYIGSEVKCSSNGLFAGLLEKLRKMFTF